MKEESKKCVYCENEEFSEGYWYKSEQGSSLMLRCGLCDEKDTYLLVSDSEIKSLTEEEVTDRLKHKLRNYSIRNLDRLILLFFGANDINDYRYCKCGASHFLYHWNYVSISGDMFLIQRCDSCNNKRCIFYIQKEDSHLLSPNGIPVHLGYANLTDDNLYKYIEKRIKTLKTNIKDFSKLIGYFFELKKKAEKV